MFDNSAEHDVNHDHCDTIYDDGGDEGSEGEGGGVGSLSKFATPTRATPGSMASISTPKLATPPCVTPRASVSLRGAETAPQHSGAEQPRIGT